MLCVSKQAVQAQPDLGQGVHSGRKQTETMHPNFWVKFPLRHQVVAQLGTICTYVAPRRIKQFSAFILFPEDLGHLRERLTATSPLCPGPVFIY
jgi:hypothetical protein